MIFLFILDVHIHIFLSLKAYSMNDENARDMKKKLIKKTITSVFTGNRNDK